MNYFFRALVGRGVLPSLQGHSQCMLCGLIGEPIKHSAKLFGEPVNGRIKTGTSHSVGHSFRVQSSSY